MGTSALSHQRETSGALPAGALVYTSDNNRFTVRHIPEWMRLSIIGLVVLPKISVAFWVAYVGSEFLLLTHCSASLVLKVLTCAYFMSIDKLLFKAFVSQIKQRRLINT